MGEICELCELNVPVVEIEYRDCMYNVCKECERLARTEG